MREADLERTPISLQAGILKRNHIGDMVRFLRDGTLVHLLPEWEVRPGRTAPAIWAVYPPKKTVSSKVRGFHRLLLGRLQSGRLWGKLSRVAQIRFV